MGPAATLALVALLAAAPDTTRARHPSPGFWSRMGGAFTGHGVDPHALVTSFTLVGGEWPSLARLSPAPRGFTPPFDGRLRRAALGLGVALVARCAGTPQRALLMGPDWVPGALFGSPARPDGVEAGSGRAVRARVTAGIGWLDWDARVAWWGRHRIAQVESGIGAYWLTIEDDIDGIGLTSLGFGYPVTAGGHVGVGLVQRIGHTPVGIDCEARVHAFRFRRLGAGFPGQSASGPLFELSLGPCWAP